MAEPNQAVKVNSASGGRTPGVNAISVCRPRCDVKKKCFIAKFENLTELTKWSQAKMERENNFKEFKSAYDLDTQPKFGAGSEFGREQKEEARKKKYGIKIRKYNLHEQPWLVRAGAGKQGKKFKGTKNGGVLENASYYMLVQRPDGFFETREVDEWYDFHPLAKYKALTAEEAEEEYSKREKTFNHYAIMLNKRRKAENQDGDADEGETAGKKKSSKKDKSLMLTEKDEWGLSDEEDSFDDDDNREDRDEDDEDSSKKKKKKQKKEKDESDNEAIEEQDDFDEGQEVDYMSGSSSDDEQMYEEKGREKNDKYELIGVVDEEGLKKLLDSDEEEEEEKKDEENEEEEEGRTKEEHSKDSDSESSSDSDIDSDPEKEYNFSSPFLLSDKKPFKKQLDETDSSNTNRPTTPSSDDLQSNGKRKKPETQSPPNAAKKPKLENAGAVASTSSAPMAGTSSSSSTSQSDGGIEGLVKRYLSRKPMTLKDLLQKVTSKYPSMPKDQIVKVVGQILQRLKLEKLKAHNKLYFSIKKDNTS